MRAILTILLGAGAATGFAPLGLLPVTILCVAGWLWLVHDAATLRRALATGWLFGLGHFTVNNNWIQHAFDYQDRMPPVLGYGAVVGLALYLAVYPMVAAGIMWRLASPRSRGDAATPMGASFVAVAGAVWIVAEWLRATMFTGYAWDPLGTAWLTWVEVARGARFVGTYAMSGLLVVVAGAVALVAGTRRWRLAAGAAGVLALLVGADLVREVPVADPAGPRLRVVQPNVDQQIHTTPEQSQAMLRRLAGLSGRPGAVSRLVLWPEGAVDPYLEDGYPRDWYWRGDPAAARATIAGALGPRDHALVGGTALAFGSDGTVSGAANSAFVVRPDATLGGRYDKAHLVPYGEYLPMRTVLAPLGLSRLVAGEVDFVDGPGPRALDVPGIGAVGIQICYEIIFSGQVVDPARRPQLLFNPSNDGWFGSWGPPQHLAQARMRAIEEGLPIARSTPNGISAIIGGDGAVLAQVPRHVMGAVELPLPPAYAPTPFARAGNWMALGAVLALVALAFAVRRR